ARCVAWRRVAWRGNKEHRCVAGRSAAQRSGAARCVAWRGNKQIVALRGVAQRRAASRCGAERCAALRCGAQRSGATWCAAPRREESGGLIKFDLACGKIFNFKTSIMAVVARSEAAEPDILTGTLADVLQHRVAAALAALQCCFIKND